MMRVAVVLILLITAVGASIGLDRLERGVQARGPTAAAAKALTCWTVPGTVIRVIDGDTFVAASEIWLASAGSQFAAERVRVLGVNAPELTGATAGDGYAAKVFTTKWLADRKDTVTLEACQRDSFGRVLAEVRGREDGASLGEALLASGNAKKFP